MTKSSLNDKSEGNFWSGLSLGIVFGATSLFFLGTKKGREKLRSIVDALEHVEDLGGDLLEDIRVHFEEGLTIENKGAETNDRPQSNIQTVIDKIQSVLPEKKVIKKYIFDKQGSAKNIS